jgi:hypothetical protein
LQCLVAVAVAGVVGCLAADVLARSLGVHEQGHDETVQTQDFGENEDQNHSDEQPGLLGGSSDTSVTDNSDGKTSSHTRETDGETSTELDEVGVERRVLLEAVGDQDGHDETVDTDDTSHDNGDNVYAVLADVFRTIRLKSVHRAAWSSGARRTLDDQIRAEDTHGADTYFLR